MSAGGGNKGRRGRKERGDGWEASCLGAWRRDESGKPYGCRGILVAFFEEYDDAKIDYVHYDKFPSSWIRVTAVKENTSSTINNNNNNNSKAPNQWGRSTSTSNNKSFNQDSVEQQANSNRINLTDIPGIWFNSLRDLATNQESRDLVKQAFSDVCSSHADFIKGTFEKAYTLQGVKEVATSAAQASRMIIDTVINPALQVLKAETQKGIEDIKHEIDAALKAKQESGKGDEKK